MLSCIMIHELKTPSCCPILGSYIFKDFSIDFFVLWILDLFTKYPASQFVKHFFTPILSQRQFKLTVSFFIVIRCSR